MFGSLKCKVILYLCNAKMKAKQKKTNNYNSIIISIHIIHVANIRHPGSTEMKI